MIVTQDFASAVPEARKQQAAWTKYIDFSRVKAFVNIVVSPAVEWGARNIVLSAGLGGMRPNIAVLGFYNLEDLTLNKPLIDITPPDGSSTSVNPTNKVTRNGKDRKIDGLLPTDDCKREDMMSVMSYVTILEDVSSSKLYIITRPLLICFTTALTEASDKRRCGPGFPSAGIS